MTYLKTLKEEEIFPKANNGKTYKEMYEELKKEYDYLKKINQDTVKRLTNLEIELHNTSNHFPSDEFDPYKDQKFF